MGNMRAEEIRRNVESEVLKVRGIRVNGGMGSSRSCGNEGRGYGK